jgi:sigma-54 specific flagellar transcriptional regulator A
MAGRARRSATTVLIQGETGTGKELVAEALHVASGRKGDNISVNCAAIPSELLESELFGHEKGAFTGADRARAGRFEQANHRTLFLDEIGDMSLPLQSKLLRALENKTIQRVGGDKEIKIDLRLICATHQNIEKNVDDGKFRADLYFRINVFPIIVPNLAERIIDLPVFDRILVYFHPVFSSQIA